MEFNEIFYTVTRFDGDYAYLKKIGEKTDEEKLVALALLPEGVDEGTRLRFYMFQYEIVG